MAEQVRRYAGRVTPLLLLPLGVAVAARRAAPLPHDSWVDPSPHRVRFVVVRPGVQLEVLDWGGPAVHGASRSWRAGVPLVLLAGYGNTAHVFDGFAPRFRDRRRVLAITRRGFGASTLAPGGAAGAGYDNATLAGDVLAVLETLGLTGANRPVLVAHSFGGAELNAIARLRPAAARGLVYLDAGFDFAELYADTAWTRVRIPRPPEPVGGIHSVGDALAYGRQITGPGYPEAEVRAQGSWGERLAATPAFHADSLERWLMRGTPSADLRAIRLPVLAVYGVPRSAEEKYPWVITAPAALRAQAERRFAIEAPILARQRGHFRREVPSARVVEIAGGRHFVFLTHPREVAAAMRRFLRDRGPARVAAAGRNCGAVQAAGAARALLNLTIPDRPVTDMGSMRAVRRGASIWARESGPSRVVAHLRPQPHPCHNSTNGNGRV